LTDDLSPNPATVARLREEFDAELRQAATDRALQAVRDRYLARKGGFVSALMKAVAGASPRANVTPGPELRRLCDRCGQN